MSEHVLLFFIFYSDDFMDPHFVAGYRVRHTKDLMVSKENYCRLMSTGYVW